MLAVPPSRISSVGVRPRVTSWSSQLEISPRVDALAKEVTMASSLVDTGVSFWLILNQLTGKAKGGG